MSTGKILSLTLFTAIKVKKKNVALSIRRVVVQHTRFSSNVSHVKRPPGSARARSLKYPNTRLCWCGRSSFPHCLIDYPIGIGLNAITSVTCLNWVYMYMRWTSMQANNTNTMHSVCISIEYFSFCALFVSTDFFFRLNNRMMMIVCHFVVFNRVP